VGNIVTGNETQTDAVLREGALPRLRKLLTSSRINIVKEAAWSISNVTAGTQEQIQAVIDADIIPVIINVLKTVSNIFHYTVHVQYFFHVYVVLRIILNKISVKY